MKYNIDQLFKSKLQDIKVDYKPEYWKEMENMLDKKPLGVVAGASLLSGISALFLKTAIYISSALIIGTGGYFLIDSLNKEKSVSTINETNSNNNRTKTDPCIELEQISTEMPTENQIESPNKFTPANLPFKADYFKYLTRNECFQKEVFNEDYSVKLSKEDFYLSYEEPIYEKTIGQINCENKNKPMENKTEPKHIKPMEKPMKDVFKKKTILQRIGIKK